MFKALSGIAATFILATQVAAGPIDIIESIHSEAPEEGAVKVAVSVTNNTSAYLSAFMIGTNSPVMTEDLISQGFDRETETVGATYPLKWEGDIYSKEKWQEGQSFWAAPTDSDEGAVIINTLDYAWDSIFSGFSHVFVYYNDIEFWGGHDAIGSGETKTGFFFEAGQMASPFLAVFSDGSSYVGETLHDAPVTVPEPASAALLLAGLLGLLAMRRRSVSRH
ncbi:PEP-CTERM sorting domain-containing protein [Simiduia agarivorans]|uniref:Ice-binding protein C-terminal domain-containing protein n=1 Tax=Simiduia agarivorans (strain DSM 21679 / JCM 13881 / BCRC 17597 / SA1) TaxID=1117647 RepID=K4KK73_SIMAS|nr:PEP-CTERM sorting domain-containing protein [Simiduia agarivorans]AFU98625.1 hypothetical protein M5M_07150 [Simiduia agarivorans SA1 = DSM 21679]